MLFSPVRSAFVLGIALGLAFASTACDGSIGIPSAPSSVSGTSPTTGSAPGLRGPVESPFLPSIPPADGICDGAKVDGPGAITDALNGVEGDEVVPPSELETICFQFTGG